MSLALTNDDEESENKKNQQVHQALFTHSTQEEVPNSEDEYSHVSTDLFLPMYVTNYENLLDDQLTPISTHEFALTSVLGTEEMSAGLGPPDTVQFISYEKHLDPNNPRSKIISVTEIDHQNSNYSSSNIDKNIANISLEPKEPEISHSIIILTDQIYQSIKTAKADFDNYVNQTTLKNKQKLENKVYHDKAKQQFEASNPDDISLSSSIQLNS